jgi:cell division protein ZapA
MGTPVELHVGGQTYRVLASAEESELRRLADIVDDRLRSLTAPGRQVSSQTLVLAAIALAHDLEEERSRRRQVEERSRQMLERLLQRVDAALEADEQANAHGNDEDAEDAQGESAAPSES